MRLKTIHFIFKAILLIRLFTTLLCSNKVVLNNLQSSNEWSRPNLYYYFYQQELKINNTLNIFKYKKNKPKLRIPWKHNYKWLLLTSTLILLSGDVELNPGPSNECKLTMDKLDCPSTSTGIYHSPIKNRDQRYIRPCFKY